MRDDHVTVATSVSNLGIQIDSDVSMKSHVSKTVSSCFSGTLSDQELEEHTACGMLAIILVELVVICLPRKNLSKQKNQQFSFLFQFL